MKWSDSLLALDHESGSRRLTLTPQHLPVTVPRPWLYGQLASGPDSRRLPLCIYDLHGLDLPWIVGTGLGGPASLAWILPVPPRSQHLGPGPTRRPMRLTGTTTTPPPPPLHCLAGQSPAAPPPTRFLAREGSPWDTSPPAPANARTARWTGLLSDLQVCTCCVRYGSTKAK